MKKIAKKIFPPLTFRRKVLVGLLNGIGVNHFSFNPVDNYLVEKSSEIQRILPGGLLPSYQPLISIVVPTYNVRRQYFDALLVSVLNQSYSNFELIIINGGDNEKTNAYLSKVGQYDKRVKYFSVKNKGISGNTNAGIERSNGEFIALLDHDDLLHPDALLFVVNQLNTTPKCDLIYTDEGKVTEDGEHYIGPHYKPDFSPALLRNLNYITHFSVIRKTILDSVGLLDISKDGAQDFDLFLRIMDHTKHIAHIPKVLYHWREAVGSTSVVFENKPQVAQAGISALTDHFARNKMEVKASIRKNTPGFYRVEYVPPQKVVSILINSHGAGFIEKFIEELLENTDSKHIAQLVIINHPQEKVGNYKVERLSNELLTSLRSGSDVIVLMNDLVMPNNKNWLDTLVSYLYFPNTDAVCPTTIDYLGRVIDKGSVLIEEGVYPIFQGMKKDQKTSFGDIDWDRNVNILSHSVACFKSTSIPESPFSTLDELIDQVSVQCTNSGNYITSIGGCYLELVYSTRESSSSKDPSYFSPNLSPFGNENFLSLYDAQLPVTDKRNLINTLQ